MKLLKRGKVYLVEANPDNIVLVGIILCLVAIGLLYVIFSVNIWK